MVGVVLSLIINFIINSPVDGFTGVSVLIFLTGASGLIVCLSAFKCFKRQSKSGLVFVSLSLHFTNKLLVYWNTFSNDYSSISRWNSINTGLERCKSLSFAILISI